MQTLPSPLLLYSTYLGDVPYVLEVLGSGIPHGPLLPDSRKFRYFSQQFFVCGGS